jgi:hypothetical protein
MASSRGKQAYGAIMLALTLVIMATIVGLLILMVYLCMNIAYKFIPDKAKKNVKRMFTRKKDGAAAADDEPGIKRGRSVVEATRGSSWPSTCSTASFSISSCGSVWKSKFYGVFVLNHDSIIASSSTPSTRRLDRSA